MREERRVSCLLFLRGPRWAEAELARLGLACTSGVSPQAYSCTYTGSSDPPVVIVHRPHGPVQDEPEMFDFLMTNVILEKYSPYGVYDR